MLHGASLTVMDAGVVASISAFRTTETGDESEQSGN